MRHRRRASASINWSANLSTARSILSIFRPFISTFQDVYSWAGEFRTVDISKGAHTFGLHQHIAFSLDNTFAGLRAEGHLAGADERQFANRAAHYLGEINAIHPFREGNGRTQREFIRELAHQNSFVLHWARISQGQMIEASRQSLTTSNAGLERLLWDALEK